MNTKQPNSDLQLPKALSAYIDADFASKLKAKFLYRALLIMTIMLGALLINTVYIQNVFFGHYDSITILAEFFLVLVFVASIVLLRKGYMSVSIHTVLTLCFSVIWLIIFTHDSTAVTRLDTIVFSYTIIAIVPIVTNNNKAVIIFYTGMNVITLWAFVYYASWHLDLHQGDLIDYLTDNTVAFVLTGLISYHVYDIYKTSFVRAEISLHEAKEAEAKVKELNENLEERVLKRTAELEELNSELNRFAYIVSHDLKAPLRGIAQLSEWLKSDYGEKLGDEGMELAQMINERAHHLNNLIDGILRYSRIQRDKADDSEFYIADLLSKIVQLHLSNERVSIEYNNTMPVVNADIVRMEQVFMNLVQNAIDHNDKPVCSINISAEDIGGHWQFSVEDNGPGIDPKYHDKIFQIFQSLSTDEHKISTGIGLAIVKRIIEHYDGKIWIESSAANGAKFVFTIRK